MSATMTKRNAGPRHAPELTERESFILEHLAQGLTLADIQQVMDQPVQRGSHAGEPPGKNAAQSAGNTLRLKLGAKTYAEAVHLAHRMGLLK